VDDQNDLQKPLKVIVNDSLIECIWSGKFSYSYLMLQLTVAVLILPKFVQCGKTRMMVLSQCKKLDTVCYF